MIPFFFTFYRFIKGFWAALHDPEYEVLITLALVILGTGTLFYHGTEGWSWLDSLYFCVITLTTVGYGDITPHTVPGKLFTIAYIFVGIGVLLGFINAVSKHTIRQSKEEGVLFPKNIPFITRKKKRAKVDEEE